MTKYKIRESDMECFFDQDKYREYMKIARQFPYHDINYKKRNGYKTGSLAFNLVVNRRRSWFCNLHSDDRESWFLRQKWKRKGYLPRTEYSGTMYRFENLKCSSFAERFEK